MNTGIYAAYRGDRYIGEGTLSELAKLLGVKRQTLVWYRCPAAKKRVEKTERTAKYGARAGSISYCWKRGEDGAEAKYREEVQYE